MRLRYRTTSPCCKAKLWFRGIAGMIWVWREEAGRKVFDARCPECGKCYEVDGGKAD